MPNCPDCGTELGVWELGTVCPACKRVFNKIETAGLPGYDREFAEGAYRFYRITYAAGLLGPGANKIDFTDDALIITREVDPS